MKLNLKRPLILAFCSLFGIFSLLLRANIATLTQPQPILAHGGSNDECEDIQDNDIEGTEDLVTHIAPSGQIVTGVCIKSGNNMFGDGHSELLGNGIYENNCYVVSGVNSQTVTVTRIGSGSTCQGISHVDVYTGPATTPTPTPTPTSTPTPTPTPTEDPEDPGDPGDPGEPSEPTSTPTPTPTEEVTPTPTPTLVPQETPHPQPQNQPGTGGVQSSTSSENTNQSGSVLGTSTLASTGAFTDILSNTALTLGLTLSALSYAFKKRR